MVDHSNVMPIERIHTGEVVANKKLCREHFRITLRLNVAIVAAPGQFVHLSPHRSDDRSVRTCAKVHTRETNPRHMEDLRTPFLRRAFSVASLTVDGGTTAIDVIYRVVGTATRWLATLCPGDRVSVLGPLGNRFPIHPTKRHAWTVAGGVGLPPMLYLARTLALSEKQTVCIYGAQSSDLLAVTLNDKTPPASDATVSTRCLQELADVNVGAVISTDDGTLGYRGHVGAALRAFHDASPPPADDLVVYTCGPERMMHFVATYCQEKDIECYVCMERAMACGTGICQSCVVPVLDDTDDDGWQYRLCCTDGPVFNGQSIVW